MKTTLIIAILASAATSPLAAGTFFECVDPKKPPCTASSEENKKKCPHACKTWVEVSGKQWLANLQANDPKALWGANFTFDAAVQALYGVDLFPKGAPPKTDLIYTSPQKYLLKTLPANKIEVGTLFLLPTLTGVVTQPAENPLDSMVVYSSARLDGKPNEAPLRTLVDGATPKFVEPSAKAMNVTPESPPHIE